MSGSSKALTWEQFAAERPEMASFGAQRFGFKVMYLSTIRPDSFPRIHPFTPFLGSGHLFAFMESTSPKAKDLQRNGKYSMHSLVTDMHGTNGEFQITGLADLVKDPSTRELATGSCPYKPKERYVLFEFKIRSCLTNHYTNGRSNVSSWKYLF